MQFRDGIAAIGVSQCQDAHAERLALRHLVAGNVEELIAGQLKLGPESRQIFLDQPETGIHHSRPRQVYAW